MTGLDAGDPSHGTFQFTFDNLGRLTRHNHRLRVPRGPEFHHQLQLMRLARLDRRNGNMEGYPIRDKFWHLIFRHWCFWS